MTPGEHSAFPVQIRTILSDARNPAFKGKCEVAIGCIRCVDGSPGKPGSDTVFHRLAVSLWHDPGQMP